MAREPQKAGPAKDTHSEDWRSSFHTDYVEQQVDRNLNIGNLPPFDPTIFYRKPDNEVKIEKNKPIPHNGKVNKEKTLRETINKLVSILDDSPDLKPLAQEMLGDAFTDAAWDEAQAAEAEKAAKIYQQNLETIQAKKRKKWSEEMKLTKATGKRNPAQFIREEFAKELSAGILCRSMLASIDFPLSKAYGNWIKPSRHPSDTVNFAPEPEKTKASKSQKMRKWAESSSRYRAKKMAATAT